jgi:hypothetical protein
MEYIIRFTPESVANFLNEQYEDLLSEPEYKYKEITTEMVEEHWECFENYFEQIVTSGLMSNCVWDDFNSVAEEWEIPFFESE